MDSGGYEEEQQEMDSCHKNSGWHFGTLKDYIQKWLEMNVLRIREMQVKGSTEMQMGSNEGLVCEDLPADCTEVVDRNCSWAT